MSRGLTLFGMRKKGKPIIKCNKCHRIINKVKPKWKKVGDIEYYYLKCTHCKEVYTISATDTALRQSIKRFEKITAKAQVQGRKPTEKELQEAQELLRANVARNREIKAQYPLEIKP